MIAIVKCSTQKLRTDNSPAALDSNYYSAEIDIENKKYFGLAIGKAPTSGPFEFSVTGYYTGIIRVESDECNYTESKKYVNYSTEKFSLDMGKHKRCLISISVFPEFTTGVAGKQYWYGTKGLVMVYADKRPLIANMYRGHGFGEFNFKFTTYFDVTRFFIKGCGIKFDQTYFKGRNIEFFHVNADENNKICIMEGFLKSKKSDDTVLFLNNFYDESYIRLPIPKFDIEYRKLTVHADQSVSVMNFKGETILSNEGTFVHDTSVKGYLRMMTVKGRIMMCEVEGLGDPKCFQ